LLLFCNSENYNYVYRICWKYVDNLSKWLFILNVIIDKIMLMSQKRRGCDIDCDYYSRKSGLLMQALQALQAYTELQWKYIPFARYTLRRNT